MAKTDGCFVHPDFRAVFGKIPEAFWYALGGELVSVFGRSALDEQTLSCITSSCGFSAALYAACGKLGLMWLWEYGDRLPWYSYDFFVSDLADAVLERFGKEKQPGNSNPYFALIGMGCRRPFQPYGELQQPREGRA